MVINVVNDVELRVADKEVVIFIVVKGVEETGHHGVRDRGRDTNARLFWSGTLKPFTFVLCGLGCSWARWEIFGDGLIGEMGSTADESWLDCGKQG
jgi:hypothetical protein